MANQNPTINWSDAIRFWTVGAIAMFTCLLAMMPVKLGGKMIDKAASKLTDVGR